MSDNKPAKQLPHKVPKYKPFAAHNPAPKKELPMPTSKDIAKVRRSE